MRKLVAITAGLLLILLGAYQMYEIDEDDYLEVLATGALLVGIGIMEFARGDPDQV